MNVTSPSFRTLGHFLDTKWTRKEVHVASYAWGLGRFYFAEGGIEGEEAKGEVASGGVGRGVGLLVAGLHVSPKLCPCEPSGLFVRRVVRAQVRVVHVLALRVVSLRPLPGRGEVPKGPLGEVVEALKVLPWWTETSERVRLRSCFERAVKV